jgi:hypothetical protein
VLIFSPHVESSDKIQSPFYKRPAVCHFPDDRRPVSGR